MTIGELEIFIDNSVSSNIGYIGRLLLTLFVKSLKAVFLLK